MDIRKIALFLAGKLPPYYGRSNLYSFTKALRKFAKEEYTNEEMTFIQQQAKGVDEEVYFMILDELWNSLREDENGGKTREDIIKMLKGLGVKDEVIGVDEIFKINIEKLEELKNELKQIPTGRKDGADKKFEEWTGKFIKNIFKDSMKEFYLKDQTTSLDGLDIRDWLMMNNPKNNNGIIESLWKDIARDVYGSNFIVIECKNYTNEASQSIINTTEKYLEQPGIGRFCLLFTRKGLIKKGEEKILKLLRGSQDKKSIAVILLDDDDYKNIIDKKIKGEIPEKYLLDKYFDLQTKI